MTKQRSLSSKLYLTAIIESLTLKYRIRSVMLKYQVIEDCKIRESNDAYMLWYSSRDGSTCLAVTAVNSFAKWSIRSPWKEELGENKPINIGSYARLSRLRSREIDSLRQGVINKAEIRWNPISRSYHIGRLPIAVTHVQSSSTGQIQSI